MRPSGRHQLHTETRSCTLKPGAHETYVCLSALLVARTAGARLVARTAGARLVARTAGARLVARTWSQRGVQVGHGEKPSFGWTSLAALILANGLF